MKKGIDPSNELKPEAFKNTDILLTSNTEDLRQASFHIIAVPTPTNFYNLPDLTPVLKASETVGRILKKGTMWFMNRRFTRDAPKKIACRCLKNFRGLNTAPISRLAFRLKG